METRHFLRLYVLSQALWPFLLCWIRWNFVPEINFDLFLVSGVGGILLFGVIGFVKIGLSLTKGVEKAAWGGVIFLFYGAFLFWTLYLKLEPQWIEAAQTSPGISWIIKSRIESHFIQGREAAALYLLSQGTTAALVGMIDLGLMPFFAGNNRGTSER